ANEHARRGRSSTRGRPQRAFIEYHADLRATSGFRLLKRGTMPDITNPLDAAIAHLEQQKAEIDTLIQNIKRFRDSGGLPAVPSNQLIATGTFEMDSIPSDAFFGMTIVDAAIKFLRMVGRRPQSTNAIIEAFQRGALKGKNYGTVYGVLNRRAKIEGDIVNVHGDWGL